ncbi:MAG TPA: hypothetical protein VGM25_15725 [Caulobacteraceae bacterium]
MASRTATEALDRLGPAHAALLQQTDLQFQLSAAAPHKPSPLYQWLAKLLKPLGEALAPAAKALAPIAPYIFWAGVAIGAAFILFLICQRLFGMKRGLVIGGLKLSASPEPWRPAPEQARALLEEADRLAGDGRFVEAAHLILLRSVQDIEARRPRAVAISLTSRDISRLEVLPPSARLLFGGIAEAVEISLFGGRPMDGEGYARCRNAYSSFVQAGSWA